MIIIYYYKICNIMYVLYLYIILYKYITHSMLYIYIISYYKLCNVCMYLCFSTAAPRLWWHGSRGSPFQVGRVIQTLPTRSWLQ